MNKINKKACICMHKSDQVRIRYPGQCPLTGSRVIPILLDKRSRASSDTDTLNSQVARHLVHPNPALHYCRCRD